jgi:tol-pal system protein YbgF
LSIIARHELLRGEFHRFFKSNDSGEIICQTAPDERQDQTMKKLMFTAIVILFLVLCVVPAMQAQDAVSDRQSQTEALKEIRDGLRSMQERQADIGADMTTLADQIRKLRGDLEAMSGNPDQLKLDRQEMQSRIEDLAARMRVIENLVGAGDIKSTAKDPKADRVQARTPETQKEGKPDLKDSYFEAFSDYKSGKFDEARGKFQAFLKDFPNASLASGAQFWIGECYYVQGNIEKAILEYDKVIKNYPKGDMVPHALLKQGLSFLKLGDKTGARILLEKLSADYPGTHQANIARSTLTSLK